MPGKEGNVARGKSSESKMPSFASKIQSVASKCRSTASNVESSAVIFESEKSNGESICARRDRPRDAFDRPVLADGLPFVLLGSKKNEDSSFAGDGRSTAVLFRFIARKSELEKNKRRSNESGDELSKWLRRTTFVREPWIKNTYRFKIALFRSFANKGRYSARNGRSVDDGGRCSTSRDGLTKSGAESVAGGAH